MKRGVIIMMALMMSSVAWGQQPNIEITRNGNTLDVKRSGWGTFTVAVHLTADSIATNWQFRVTEPEERIVLTGMDPTSGTITWDWLQASVDSNADTAFIYRMPFNGCKKAAVHALANHDLGIYRGVFRNFRVWQFDLSRGRKVFPIREGQVIRVTESDITVEHPDGSQAVYSVVEGIAVVEGQQITTKTQLGVAGTLYGQTQYMVRVGVYYYESAVNRMTPSIFASQIYIDPVFKRGHLKDGTKVRGN